MSIFKARLNSSNLLQLHSTSVEGPVHCFTEHTKVFKSKRTILNLNFDVSNNQCIVFHQQTKNSFQYTRVINHVNAFCALCSWTQYCIVLGQAPNRSQNGEQWYKMVKFVFAPASAISSITGPNTY